MSPCLVECVTQYEINLTIPVFIHYKDGTKIQNGCLADYPGRPVPKSLDRFMRFDLLRHTIPFGAQIRSLAKAIESFPEEWKRQARIALRAHAGMPQDPIDMLGPIN
jgi:hypothetical protein